VLAPTGPLSDVERGLIPECAHVSVGRSSSPWRQQSANGSMPLMGRMRAQLATLNVVLVFLLAGPEEH